MAQPYYILMADVRRSRKHDANVLMPAFEDLVDQTNIQIAEAGRVVAPLTISLGDECQAIFANLYNAVNCILKLEHNSRMSEVGFKLRYVINYGMIDSEIQGQPSRNMLGMGLIQARDLLQGLKKKRRSRFIFSCRNKEDTDFLNNAFLIYNKITKNWKERDQELIATFMADRDYKKVAEKLGKDRSLVWRRERGLWIRQFFALEDMIMAYCSRKEE